MNIACATDFSVHARAAADVAAALARRTGDTLALYHVLSYAGFGAVVARVIDSFENQAREYLALEAFRLREHGVPVVEQVLKGLPDEAIVEEASPESTRLVVVGSLGHRDPERWELGSISERIAERAHVPTLVVRDSEPFRQWSAGQRSLKIFVACDLKDTSFAALKWLKDFQAIAPCELVVGHVDSPLEEQNRLGLQGPLSLDENPPGIQERLEQQLRENTGRVLGEIPFRIRVNPCLGRPDCGVLESAQEEKADLLVVGTHQTHGLARLWHQSVSRALLHHAPMSVLVVPPSLPAGTRQPAAGASRLVGAG